MVSKRTPTGMNKKIRKGEKLSIEWYFKMKGTKPSYGGKCVAKIESNRKATCIKDNRPLKKMNKRWVYIAK